MANKGFTLVELLIVIGILAILSTVTVLILNPADFIARANDSRRLNDLSSINQALTLYNLRAQTPAFGDPTKVYISLPDINGDVNDDCKLDYPTLPALSGSWQYHCNANSSNLRKVDGSGWIPVSFASLNQDNPLAVLPVDPINDASQNFYYTYVTGGSWELTAMLQSVSNHNAAVGDGGPMPGVYEIGSNLILGPANRDLGLVGYWKFDEGSGTLYDASGKGNNGTPYGGVAYGVQGRVGNALSFNGTDGYVEVPNATSLNPGSNSLTIISWFKLNSAGTQNGSILYNKENLYEASAGGGYFTYAWQPHWAWDGGTSFPVNVGEWYHAAIVYDKSNQYVYKNGVLVYSRAQTGNVGINTNALRVGARGAPGAASSFFPGFIDEVRIYNRALSASEIQAIYSSAN